MNKGTYPITNSALPNTIFLTRTLKDQLQYFGLVVYYLYHQRKKSRALFRGERLILEPITVSSGQTRQAYATEIGADVTLTLLQQSMLSNGDSSRNCIKLSIAEAEVAFDATNDRGWRNVSRSTALLRTKTHHTVYRC